MSEIDYPIQWNEVPVKDRERLAGNTRTTQWISCPASAHGEQCISHHILAKKYPGVEELVKIGSVIVHPAGGDAFFRVETLVNGCVKWYEETGIVRSTEWVSGENTNVISIAENAKQRVLTKALEMGLI